MKAVVKTQKGVGFIEVRDMPVPSPAKGEVKIRIEACGVCGSDLHCSHAGPDGYVSFGGPARLPVVLGHEFTGTVIRAGSAVTNVAVGDLVTAESIWACWTCDECRAGHLNECRRVELLGLTMDGALAPLVRVDARHCYSIAPLVGSHGRDGALELGALLEPMGVAHRGLIRARVRADDRLAVFGTHLPSRVQRWAWNAQGEARSREFDRQWAVACCGLLNENALTAHAALLRACKDRNPDVRYEAVRSLLRTGVPVEQALAALTERMLHDSTSEVRWSAAFYIGLLEEKAEPALPALRQATNDQSSHVAGDALEALEKVEAALAQKKGKPQGK